jgi:uncharacterized protein YkwD
MQREAGGLKELEENAALAAVAQALAVRMATKGAFNPGGEKEQTIKALLAQNDLSYKSIQPRFIPTSANQQPETVTAAVQNDLRNRDYTDLGVGAASDRYGTWYIVVIFAEK